VGRKKISMVARMLGLIAVSILLSAVVVMALSTHQYAEAKPVKMSPTKHFSYWKSGVCGDKLCMDKNFSRTAQYIGKSKTPR
jgi:hypothetical protein